MKQKQTIRLNEKQFIQIIKESVKRMLYEENDKIKTFKHCHISKHPLNNEEYMVVNDTFKNIPPFFGTKGKCEKAAIAAEKSAENYLNSLIEKARKDGYSEDEISKAVKKLLRRCEENIRESLNEIGGINDNIPYGNWMLDYDERD